jgi:hypothetical protein
MPHTTVEMLLLLLLLLVTIKLCDIMIGEYCSQILKVILLPKNTLMRYTGSLSVDNMEQLMHLMWMN